MECSFKMGGEVQISKKIKLSPSCAVMHETLVHLSMIDQLLVTYWLYQSILTDSPCLEGNGWIEGSWESQELIGGEGRIKSGRRTRLSSPSSGPGYTSIQERDTQTQAPRRIRHRLETSGGHRVAKLKQYDSNVSARQNTKAAQTNMMSMKYTMRAEGNKAVQNIREHEMIHSVLTPV